MIVISINMYFLYAYVTDKLGTKWFVIVGMIFPAALYLGFVAYLVENV